MHHKPLTNRLKKGGICLSIVLLISIIVFFAAGVLFAIGRSGGTANARITFLNVGQGDAALVETARGFQVLVDTGRGGSILRELGAALAADDKRIDMVVVTHPDADHIGGLEAVLDAFEVGYIVVPDTDDLYEKHDREKAVREEGAGIIVPTVPSRLVLPDGLILEFLWAPDGEAVPEANSRSVVVRIENDGYSALLTGDIPAAVERELVALYGEKIRSNLLKLSHHGSKTSSDPLFLSVVMPQDVVVSAGANNRYGHPHKEVIDRVKTLLPETNIHHTSQKERVVFALSR